MKLMDHPRPRATCWWILEYVCELLNGVEWWSAVEVWDNHLLLLSVHSSLCYVVIVSGQIEFVSSDSREMYSSRGSNDQREEMNLGTNRTQQKLLDVREEERLRLDAVIFNILE
ncbi:uncharacterized protein LOC119302186 [Triticum dicoccoides]|uniref:uncharacterized protein LOC119302186 n=1 Tax=Triticum dicoccoides TaxID=85692 RepID=UPI000E79B4D8|nr:uncharacterized protein LOC119302186 [Triticum dicoccoides]XP_037435116.1 uncharacterized protein LOC119302186 [Triticum dicoccoides]XP_037435117.1 uncharacterized protein LOC119302186 [Triticum dicoccoides]XP_037435118.1 uncharacterized protein LOC119302186 [Triticum dicoccoides]